MISLYRTIIVFILLCIGALFYYISRKSSEEPPDDSDPFEPNEPEPDEPEPDELEPDELEPNELEPIEPVKTTPVVSDEPDINTDPEVIITTTKQDDDSELPVKPTPTTTPAKPLVPAKKRTAPVVTQPLSTPIPSAPRLLTPKELDIFMGKIRTEVKIRSEFRRKQISDVELEEFLCEMNFFDKHVTDIASKTYISESDIEVLLDPKITRMDSISKGGFTPLEIIEAFQKFMRDGGNEAKHRMCRKRAPIKIAPPVPRLLTPKELDIFMDKLSDFEATALENMSKHLSADDFEQRRCESNFISKTMIDIASKTYISESDIKAIVDPKITRPKLISNGGFIPMKITGAFKKFMNVEGASSMRMCRLPRRARPGPPSNDRINENEIVIGTRGKFANEGGVDVNNGVAQLHFKPAKTAEIYIEHVDVHIADPVNKNGSITFIYQGGIKHKFVFVGNEGLRFRKQDGTFGPNLGVGDVSKTVLTGMGLNYLTYKIECLRTAGRNTWYFKPLRLDRGLIGIELSDNADWGGLRGVYINVQITGRSRTQVERHKQERNAV